jgi:type IV secretory pathway TraG/TraD family ATPase VirD4
VGAVTATSRRSGGPGLDTELVLLWTAIGAVTVVVATVNGALRLAAWWGAPQQHLSGNPLAVVVGLATGTIRWTATENLALGVLIAVELLVVAAIAYAVVRVARRRSRVDRAAPRMGRGSALQALTRQGAAATAARLGVLDVVPGAIGLPIARTVAGDAELYQGWEDVSIDIWGPRTGKTTARAIPAILAAPGAVVATSNKRDVVDATRDLRAAQTAPGQGANEPAGAPAGEVWVFDPQRIVDEPATWWWDPLTYVTDEVKASVMADVFALASRDPGARTDAYFDSAATDLLAGLLLAAALDRRPITDVYLWLTDPTDDEPAAILRRGGYPLSAAAVAGVVNAPEKQRGGVYGTAQQIASFLTNREAVRWVTPAGPGDRRPQFDPHDFVRTRGTLYSLSKEGRGSAGPLVTALTVAVTEAAEEHAKRSPGGRLPIPMVAVLDEAANVCRWRELPNLYSHYGSRGICVMTILQSWSQGVEVWGRDGMRKLWSAANIRLYGGGVSEAEFLSELSQLVGDYDLDTRSTSHGRGGRSTQYATRRDRVLEVADLAALPRGRAVLFASGAPATLVRTLPWMDGPHAAAVHASIAAHDPQTAAGDRRQLAPVEDLAGRRRRTTLAERIGGGIPEPGSQATGERR